MTCPGMGFYTVGNSDFCVTLCSVNQHGVPAPKYFFLIQANKGLNEVIIYYLFSWYTF